MIYGLTTLNVPKHLLSTITFSSVLITSLFLRRFHVNYSTRINNNNSNSNNHQTSKKMTELLYLQLYIPMSGTNGMPISIHNDYLLSITIKEIEQSNILYVMLENKFNVSEGVVLKYISDTYSRCWDELMHQNKIKLQCIVSCDTKSFGFMNRDVLLCKNNVLKAHLSDDYAGDSSGENDDDDNTPKHIIQINNERIQRGLFPFDVQYYSPPMYPTNTLYYLDSGDSSECTSSTTDNVIPTYSKIAIGGTFDKLHNGHRKLLTLAACKCNGELTIGVISDSLLTNKTNSFLIETYSSRVQAIQDFFSLLKPSLKLKIVELHDPYGPTIVDPTYEAIIVSSETLNGAIEINRLRREKGYGDMKILVMRRSDISTLSSTYLRDRELRERNTTN